MLKNILKDFFLTNLQKEIKKSNSQIIILNDWIGLKILTDKYYEKDEIEVLKKHFNDNIKNNTFVDVGANIGVFGLKASKLFDKIEIHSFEPVPPIFEVLSNNKKLSGNPKFFVYQMVWELKKTPLNSLISQIAQRFQHPIQSYGKKIRKLLKKQFGVV